MNQEFKADFKEIQNKWQVKCIPCKFELSNLSESQAIEEADKHKEIEVAAYSQHRVTISNLWRF